MGRSRGKLSVPQRDVEQGAVAKGMGEGRATGQMQHRNSKWDRNLAQVSKAPSLDSLSVDSSQMKSCT